MSCWGRIDLLQFRVYSEGRFHCVSAMGDLSLRRPFVRLRNARPFPRRFGRIELFWKKIYIDKLEPIQGLGIIVENFVGNASWKGAIVLELPDGFNLGRVVGMAVIGADHQLPFARER